MTSFAVTCQREAPTPYPASRIALGTARIASAAVVRSAATCRTGSDVASILERIARRFRVRDDAEITLFKSVGTAIEDLAAARLLLQGAAARDD